MKNHQRRVLSLFSLCLCGLFFLGQASAENTKEDLAKCLQDFDGLAIKLPYRPTMHVRSCATEVITYDTSDKMSAGSRHLALIASSLSLGRTPVALSSDEVYWALQQATFAHFQRIFLKRGYSLVSTVNNSVEDTPNSPAYVVTAKFQRQESGRDIVLTYDANSRNMWSIKIVGMPPNQTQRAGKN
jgi:hypothetical protein